MVNQIQIINKQGVLRTLEVPVSKKIDIKSGDKIQISASDNGIFDFSVLTIANLIVLKSGKNLELFFENGDVLTLTNFYNYKNATTLEFINIDNEVQSISSTDEISSTDDLTVSLGGSSYLVYSQGDQSILLSMSEGNSVLQTSLSDSFEASSDDDSSSLGMVIAAGAGIAAIGVGLSSSSSSSSDSTSDTLTGKLIDSVVANVDYFRNGELAGQTSSDGSFSYKSG